MLPEARCFPLPEARCFPLPEARCFPLPPGGGVSSPSSPPDERCFPLLSLFRPPGPSSGATPILAESVDLYSTRRGNHGVYRPFAMAVDRGGYATSLPATMLSMFCLISTGLSHHVNQLCSVSALYMLPSQMWMMSSGAMSEVILTPLLER